MGDSADRASPQGVPEVSTILDALERAVILVDHEMTVTGWNANAEHLYGWPSSEAIGRSVYELITPPELLDFGRSVMDGVFAGHTWTGDIRVVRRDGGHRLTFSFINPVADASGAIVGAISSAYDVTDARRLEREASMVTDHLLLAFAAGDVGTWRWDRRGRLMSWDDAMCRLFGIEPRAFDGGSWQHLVHPDDIDRVTSNFAEAIEHRGAYEVDFRVVWPDRSEHWLDSRGKVFVDDADEVLGTIGYATEITDRKAVEFDARRRAAEAERLANDESRQRQRLEFLVELNDLAINAVDHRDLMHRAAVAAVPRLGDWCTVHFAPQPGIHEIEMAHSDPDRMEWARAMRDRYPLDPNAAFGVPAVLRSGRTEFFAGVDRYLQDPSTAELDAPVPSDVQAVVETLGVTSIITVPLLTKRGVIGAMQFVSAESRRRYGSDDVALAEAAAGRIAAALDNAWHSEQQREIAATLQAALLPTHLPEIPGVGVAVRYWAAGAVSDVGGDFYDVFAIDDHRWAVVIGDVCGTGAEAAAVTSTARHTIRAAATHGASPTEVLQWVNAAVLREGDGRFCTLVYTELTAIGNGSWRATTVVGGHPLPVIVDASGNVGSLGAHGTLIGALDQIRVTPTEQILGPGTTIVMHTDGVNDVPAPHGLDDVALASLITGSISVDSSADEIANRFGDAIAAILPIPERDDDVAIVVIRIS